MVYCSKCGKKNQDVAKFCIKCGNPLNLKGGKTGFEQKVEEFAEEMGRLGEKAGKKIEQATEKIGKKAEVRIDKATERFENRYKRTFGFFGPLVSGFLGLIILRFIVEILSLGANDEPVLGYVSSFLYTYLLWFFGLFLLSSYNSYFYRNYKKTHRWFSPVFTAIGSTAFFWLASKLFVILDNNLDVPTLATVASYIDMYLVAIFVFVLLLGYFIILFMFFMEQYSRS